MSRSIIINLPTIASYKRASEAEFWKEFAEAQPRILGALLDAACEGLKNFHFVEVENCEARMLDFVKFGTAIEATLCLENGEFVKLCNANYENANNVAIENNPVAILINRLMQDNDFWSGTSTDLLTELYCLADEITRRNPVFPKGSQKLSNILDRLAPNLALEGIKINKGDREGGTGRRLIKISKFCNGSSHCHTSSQGDQQDLNF